MNGFVLWGLVAGFICVGAYVGLALWRKKPAILGEGIGMLASGFGLVSALKMLWLVFSGDLSKLIAAQAAGTGSSISADDLVYFVVGGLALAWVAVEAIANRLRALFQ